MDRAGINPEAPLYNMVLTFEIFGGLDVEIFDKAFGRLVQQSDAMRTTFSMVDGKPMQQVRNDHELGLDFLDFSNKENQEAHLASWIKAHSRRQFDLSKQCFESALIKMSNERFVWYINQHHLITDAWGVSVQYKTLVSYYRNIIRGLSKKSCILCNFRITFLKFNHFCKLF